MVSIKKVLANVRKSILHTDIYVLKRYFGKNGGVIKFRRAYWHSLFGIFLLLRVVTLYGDKIDTHDIRIRKREMQKKLLLSPYVNFWYFFVTTVWCMERFRGIICIHIYSM